MSLTTSRNEHGLSNRETKSIFRPSVIVTSVGVALGIAAGCSSRGAIGASVDHEPGRDFDGSTDASGSPPCPPGWVCPARPLLTAKIGAWYSVAYQKTDAPSCADHVGWPETRFRPLRGYYDSADVATIDGHFSEMREVGIDFVILDFTNGIAPDPTVSRIYAAGEAVLGRNADPTAPEHMPISLAIGAKLWADKDVPLHDNEADFVMSHYVAPNGIENPYYFRFEGRPLLVSYNTYDADGAVGLDWTDPRFYIGRASPVITTANAKLAALGSSWWGWAMEYPNYVAEDVVTVSPGADNTRRCDCIGSIHYDRDGGSHAGCHECDVDCTFTPTNMCPSFQTTCSGALTGGAIPASGKTSGLTFQLQWLRAIKQNPGAVVIASWNDFGDETAIEPATVRPGVTTPRPWVDYYGDETPDWYAQIATGYARLRTGLESGRFYRDEDSERTFAVADGRLVEQVELPHGHPVVVLPAGTLRELGAGAPVASVTIPPETTIMTTPGKPPAMVVRGAAIRFEVEATARRFGAFTSVSEEVYASVPYAGTIRANAPVYATPGLPPAFASDIGELWQFDCIDVIAANGSHVSSKQTASQYSSFPVRGGMHCVE